MSNLSKLIVPAAAAAAAAAATALGVHFGYAGLRIS